MPLENRILVIDWESSGLIPEDNCFKQYIEGPQGIQLGAVVLESGEEGYWDKIGEFASNIRYEGCDNGNCGFYPNLTWSKKAEEIHGLTIQELSKAPAPEYVGENFLNFLIRFFKNQPVVIAGHTPSLDLYLTRQLLYFTGYYTRDDLPEIRFSHRSIDCSTLGRFLFGFASSDQLFKQVLGVERSKHNALQDANLTALIIQKAAITIKKPIWGGRFT